jgi:hypothetical protein
LKDTARGEKVLRTNRNRIQDAIVIIYYGELSSVTKGSEGKRFVGQQKREQYSNEVKVSAQRFNNSNQQIEIDDEDRCETKLTGR